MQNFIRRNFLKCLGGGVDFEKAPREALFDAELDPTGLLPNFLVALFISKGAPLEAHFDA